MSSKIRDALLKADVLVSIATFDEDVNMDEVEKIRSEIKSALAEPVRNCDIGTAEEQENRYLGHCYKQSIDTGLCLECPLFGKQKMCAFAWAQMPYDEGKNNEQ